MIPGMEWFGRTIHVRLPGGLIVGVSNFDMAKEMLLDPRWPKRTGKAYNRAVVAVLEGMAELPEAAKAFEDAARDAGVLREG